MVHNFVDQIVIESEPSFAARVYGKLWIGSAPPIGPYVQKHFDTLVLSAMEYQPMAECFMMPTFFAPMNDLGEPMTLEEKQYAVRAAGRALDWLSKDKSVLVTCMQGRNRSGLICAIILCKGPLQMEPDQAIEAVRKARGPRAIRSDPFIKFIEQYCKKLF